MKCTKCGKVIAENSIYCNYCGNRIAANETTKMPFIARMAAGYILGKTTIDILSKNSPLKALRSNPNTQTRDKILDDQKK